MVSITSYQPTYTGTAPVRTCTLPGYQLPRTDADLIEEAADIKAYNEALMEDDATRYSMDDVMHMAMEAE